MMKWMSAAGITLLAGLILTLENTGLNRSKKREKQALYMFLAIDWILAVLIIFQPDIPSPFLVLIPIADYAENLLQ